MNADSISSHPRSARDPLFVLISTVAFLLYALGVVTLDQARSPGWGVEAAGPLPSAISYLVYGVPLGALDENVQVEINRPNGVQNGVAAAASGFVPRGRLIPNTPDGLGAGSVLFATLALKMFGKNIAALVKFFLLLEGISVFAFAARFRDTRLFFIPLYFFVFTIILVTPLSIGFDAVVGMPIGGQRFFVAATFLPAVHIIFELMDGSSNTADRKEAISGNLLLFVQSVLLFATLLVRSATSYVFGVIVFAAAYRLYRDRREHRSSVGLMYKAAIILSGLAVWVVVVTAALPNYVETGRAVGNFWHRSFVGLAFHPNWPFGNLREVYKCPLIGGLSREGSADSNAFCVWEADPRNAGVPASDLRYSYFSGDYEKVIRAAYFYVVTHYPKQTFELYAFVKSEELYFVLSQSWKFLFELFDAHASKGLYAIVAIQCALFAYAAFQFGRNDSAFVAMLFFILLALFVLSIAPRYVAWSSFETAIDMIFLMYGCFVLALLWLVRLVPDLLRPPIQRLRARNQSRPLTMTD